MSVKNDPPELVNKIVLAFDICSSTSIIEDLTRTGNTVKWRNFLIWIKDYLNSMTKEFDFVIYKFTGDGWILLFNHDYPGTTLFEFIEDFCGLFKMRYRKMVHEYLETPPNISGITIGIDRGSLIRFVMNENNEYVGRPINVACRLQSAIKDKDDLPQYKALITKHLFQDIKNDLSKFKVQRVRRRLRNIADGGDILCVKVFIPH